MTQPSRDLKPIIGDWPYEPGQINVRRILGTDHRELIQMRVDLGVLQMELDHRPDGKRPHDRNSLLDYHLARVEDHKRRNGTDLGFALTPDECQLVREESLQYYQRYLAYFALEDFDAVARDTQHNLDILDLCGRYAHEEADRYALEVYRPYIIMMNTRGKALAALDRDAYLTALAHTENGLDRIKNFFEEFGDSEAYGQSTEVAILKKLRRQVRRHLPDDPIRDLKRRLADAVAAEHFEEAARLRDELNALLHDQDSDD